MKWFLLLGLLFCSCGEPFEEHDKCEVQQQKNYKKSIKWSDMSFEQRVNDAIKRVNPKLSTARLCSIAADRLFTDQFWNSPDGEIKFLDANGWNASRIEIQAMCQRLLAQSE